MDFASFIHCIEADNLNVHGIEVYKSGKLVHNYGDTVEHRYPVYSITKSILSIGVGIAWDEGRIDLDKCVLDYMPISAVNKMNKEQQDLYRKITLKRLMSMSVKGYPFRAEGESWLDYSLAYPLKNVEEKTFDYSNIPAYLVGVALTEALGEDLYGFLERKLFAPLRINNIPYSRCPDGYMYCASSLELSVHELSRIGLFLMAGGVYEGKRLLSKEYLETATSVQQMTREGGYGYLFTKYRDGFSLNGKWGQKCYVLPKDELVISFLSDMPDGSNEIKAYMEKYILMDNF